MKFNFASPYFLILIPIIIILFYKIRYNGSLKIPGIEPIKKVRKKSKTYMLGKILILSSIILMVIALARPQISSENKIIKKNGIDIVVALDLSNSMLQQDFTPNRLEVAKHLLTRFIEKRPDDRISLIVFGGDAYTKVPLTFDHSVVKDITSKLTTDDITSNNRTAIGMGLGIAINRLKNSTAKSKVIILMTDGENNSGEMSPMGAANIAKELGIKIYTIGIGAKELRYGPALIKNNELDENLLKEIAETTHGEYFRASNEKEFENIFNKINQLEKTKIDGKTYYEHIEVFENILKIALVLLIIGAFLEYIKYIRIP
ncbi:MULTISPECIES: vWA domain-containing protein [Fusobacterium]|uniref:VWA domain-containing protein n=1 Tax=Fusobacterium hominis TaxID=2764326 RepID=A0A7G9GYE1_9FUSO|nr:MULTISPECIES: VWA domain-containing protein [Fusobacterium]QNM15823.1 VWA domain-containing protein [Fusobacterium hominis]